MAQVKYVKYDAEFERNLAQVVGAILREVNAQFAAMQAKINRVESAQAEFRFRGLWREGERYAPGDVVSIPACGIYRCTRDTMARPGHDGVGWELLAKSGRDGRDGRDAPLSEPPEQRAVRSARSNGSQPNHVRTNR
jgi:hypothetical protein